MGFFPKLEVEGEFKAPLLVAIILPENPQDGLSVKNALCYRSHWALGGGVGKKGKGL